MASAPISPEREPPKLSLRRREVQLPQQPPQ
jgi:hypothetical protein